MILTLGVICLTLVSHNGLCLSAHTHTHGTTDLKRTRWHLEQAEEIDPDYCDVHQQFAHLAIQENRFLEFEERLTNALTCSFTVSHSFL